MKINTDVNSICLPNDNVNLCNYFLAVVVPTGRPPLNDLAGQLARKAVFKNQRYYCPIAACETSFAYKKDVGRHIRMEHTKTAEVSTQFIMSRFFEKFCSSE